MPSNFAGAAVAMADAAQTMISMPVFAPGAEVVIHTAEDSNAEPHLDGGPAISDADVDEAACVGLTALRGARGVIRSAGTKLAAVKTRLRVVNWRAGGSGHE